MVPGAEIRIDASTLDRQGIQRLVRLIAAFQDKKISEVSREVAESVREKTVKNLARDQISGPFREALVSRLYEAEPSARNGILETLMNRGLAKKHRKKPEPSLLDAFNPKHTALIEIGNQFELDHFDNAGFQDFPDYPVGHYVILRLHEKTGMLRASHMKVDFGKTRNRIPKFETLRANAFGRRRRVTGIMLKAEREVYAIGQVEGGDGLRFSRLRMHRSHPDDGRSRVDLYGIRLGQRAANERPFAHIIYARQIPPEIGKKAESEWMNNYGSVFDLKDEWLNSLVPEIDQIATFLDGEHITGGLQPGVLD